VTIRLAVWSGPRNLSTALMYAFAARGDCAVSDEPFYAAWLAATGADHPMRAAVLASQPTDPAAVAAALAGPCNQPLWYQKHMVHHLRPGWPEAWMAGCRHGFLIRHPARVVASYAARRENAAFEDLGFAAQAELFDRVAQAAGQAPPVLDSTDLRADPAGMLTAFCAALGVAFVPAMLRWTAGPRPFDGVWAPHWYGAVHRSTGFEGAEGPLPDLPGPLTCLAERALPLYERLAQHRLRA
jgi:hypothetical protein